MDRQELLKLMPQHKFDTGRAKHLVELGYPAVAPILPEILGCLLDANWPIAKELHNFVISIGATAAPAIRDIFEGDDEAWKYYILSPVVRFSPELAHALLTDLERIAYAPTPAEEAELVAETAAEILKDLGYKPPHEAR